MIKIQMRSFLSYSVFSLLFIIRKQNPESLKFSIVPLVHNENHATPEASNTTLAAQGCSW